MSLFDRLREVLEAVRGARFPPPPKRRYDLVAEAIAKPLGGSSGRGRVREGGVTNDDGEPETD